MFLLALSSSPSRHHRPWFSFSRGDDRREVGRVALHDHVFDLIRVERQLTETNRPRTLISILQARYSTLDGVLRVADEVRAVATHYTIVQVVERLWLLWLLKLLLVDGSTHVTRGIRCRESGSFVDTVLPSLSFLTNWLRRLLQKVKGFTLVLCKHKIGLFREADKTYRRQKALRSAFPTTPQKSQCFHALLCSHRPSCASCSHA